MTCVRKQINIYEALGRNMTYEYMLAYSFLGEMQRYSGDCKGAIISFRNVIDLQQRLLAPDELLD